MNQLFAITLRNLRQYLRDGGAIFFSLLSMFIVILLMFFFLGDANVDSITQVLAQFPGRDAARDKENARLLVLAWTCAGIVSINAVTVTQASLSYMIKDRENGKLNAIYTAPVHRGIIASGYVLAAWVSGMIVCTASLLISEVYCIAQGMTPYSLLSHLKLLGMIGVNTLTYAAMMYLVAAVVKSSGAWGGLGTVIGTLVGFLGGIYFPIGALADTVAGILKCFPVIYGTALFRSEMTAVLTEQTFEGVPAEVVTEFNRMMGITLQVGDTTLSIGHELGILLLCASVFLLAGVAAVRYSKKADR